MAITFDQVPSTSRTPATYVELDPSRALSLQPGEPQRVLLIGLKLAAGTAPVEQIVETPGELSGDPLFGTASQLSAMVRAFRRVNRTARLYALPVAEAGTAATASFALTGTATMFGVLRTRVSDLRVSTAATIGMTAAALATAHAAALNAESRSLFTATAAGGTITLTAAQKGELDNAVTIATEITPPGITAVATQPSGGTLSPSLANAIAAIDDTRYDIVSGLSDEANVSLLEAELERRFGPTVQLPGHLFVGVSGTYGALSSYGAARNSQHSTVIGAGKSPTPPWIWAAQVAARDAQQTEVQVNRPRFGLTLPDCEAPKSSERLDTSERNLLLYDGISTYRVDDSGRVSIERLITTYQENASGNPDATYLAIETIRNLAHLMIEVIALGARHQRDLLGPDGSVVSQGVPLTTPKMRRGELIALYQSRVRRGLNKDLEGFAAELIVELNETDPERIDAHLVPRLVNGMVTQAFKLSFQL